jgi:hypothetical protein
MYDSEDLDLSWLNLAGYTYYSLRGSQDFNSNVPTGINKVYGGGTYLAVEFPSCPAPEIYIGDVVLV